MGSGNFVTMILTDISIIVALFVEQERSTSRFTNQSGMKTMTVILCILAKNLPVLTNFSQISARTAARSWTEVKAMVTPEIALEWLQKQQKRKEASLSNAANKPNRSEVEVGNILEVLDVLEYLIELVEGEI